MGCWTLLLLTSSCTSKRQKVYSALLVMHRLVKQACANHTSSMSDSLFYSFYHAAWWCCASNHQPPQLMKVRHLVCGSMLQQAQHNCRHHGTDINLRALTQTLAINNNKKRSLAFAGSSEVSLGGSCKSQQAYPARLLAVWHSR